MQLEMHVSRVGLKCLTRQKNNHLTYSHDFFIPDIVPCVVKNENHTPVSPQSKELEVKIMANSKIH